MRTQTFLALAFVSLASIVACSSSSSDDDVVNPEADGGGPDSAASGGTDATTATETGTTSGTDASSSPDATSDASTLDVSTTGDGAVADSSVSEASPGACPLGAAPDAGAAGPVKYVFVVAMENHDSAEIIGNMADAPYINGTLLPCFASTSNFNDPLPLAIPSEPHYVYMEAGTNAFADATFTSDNDPSAGNSTASTLHLSTQLTASGVTWRSYQEGLDAAATGACPIDSSGFYAAKHDPFVFFQDVVGSPPSASNAGCAAHHKAFSALAGDLSAGVGSVAQYNFITPNLCDDMHGAGGCANSNTIQAGDTWLSTNLPPMIAFANAHSGVIFLVWDEGDQTLKIPFVAIGPS
ncbi:MAG TPA: alkaline phosphatase family protein, partial [Polyangiaceae bacterium]|nr:alkaline phosphatase family protein [Polyangiaceae bacterium]